MSLSRSPILLIKLTSNHFRYNTHVKIKKNTELSQSLSKSIGVDSSEEGSEIASAQAGERERGGGRLGVVEGKKMMMI